MTSHELAKELLAGADLPVRLTIADAKDTAYTNDVRVIEESTDGIVHTLLIQGWVGRDNEEAFAPWGDGGAYGN